MAFPERGQAGSVAFAFRVRFTAGAVFGESGPDLVTVDRLGDRRAAVPTRSVMSSRRTSCALRWTRTRVPQFAGRPCPAEPGGLGDLAELLPYVPAVQRRSVLAAEHEAVLLPPLPRREPFGCLAGVVLAERLYRPGGQFQDAAALAGLDVTLDPHRPVDGHRAGLEINPVPRDRPRRRVSAGAGLARPTRPARRTG